MSSACLDRASVTVEPKPPYDFVRTADYATYFVGRYGTDSFEDGIFRRPLDAGGLLVLASVRSAGTVVARPPGQRDPRGLPPTAGDDYFACSGPRITASELQYSASTRSGCAGRPITLFCAT